MRRVTLTLLLLLCASCGKATAPHVVITVSGASSQILYDRDESTKQVYHSLTGPTNKFHNPLVTIQLSIGATYELAQKAMDICTAKGLWNITLLDESGSLVKDEYIEWKKRLGAGQPDGAVTQETAQSAAP